MNWVKFYCGIFLTFWRKLLLRLEEHLVPWCWHIRKEADRQVLRIERIMVQYSTTSHGDQNVSLSNMSLPTQHSTSVDPEFCESQRRRGLFRTEDLRFEDFSQDENWGKATWQTSTRLGGIRLQRLATPSGDKRNFLLSVENQYQSNSSVQSEKSFTLSEASQWKLKVKTRKLLEARENTNDQVAVDFSCTFDWSRGLREFSGPIIEQSLVKPKQRLITSLSTLNWKFIYMSSCLMMNNVLLAHVIHCHLDSQDETRRAVHQSEFSLLLSVLNQKFSDNAVLSSLLRDCIKNNSGVILMSELSAVE